MDNKQGKKNFFRLYDAGGNMNKNWFVFYYHAGKRVRVYGEINREKTEDHRRSAAAALILQLEKSYQPPPPNFAEIELLKKALEQKKPLVSARSFQTYKSKATALFAWLDGRKITKDVLQEFLSDYAKSHEQTTVHECRRMLHNLFTAVGWKHLLSDVRVRKGTHKPLKYFQPYQVEKIKTYLVEHDPALWLHCQFIFYCFIRPRSELRFLKVEDVYFEERKIRIDGRRSKNRKSEFVAIPDAFLPALLPLQNRGAAEYIFHAERSKLKPIGRNTLGERFREILNGLGFDKNYQLYSWKHTGAVMAFKAGIGVKELQIQLRHHSLEMVDRYLRQLGLGDLDNLKVRFPKI